MALSCSEVAFPIKAVAAVILAVLPIGAIGTANFTAISYPAGITVGALPIEPVAIMAVFTWWTLVLAVLAEKAWHAHLITFGAIPAFIAGNTASFCDFTWLLTLTVTTFVPAVLPVEPSRTRFPAVFAPVAWFACAGTVCLVAFPVHALTVSFAVLAPHRITALASAGKLLTW